MKLLHENTINDPSGLVLLRSKIRAVSRRMGFDEAKISYAELVGTELFTNQQKYVGNGGLIQIWETETPQRALEIFAIDYGPGIESVEEATKDGFSTGQTMGKGLGSVLRLSDDSEIYSVQEKQPANGSWHGVAVWSRFYQEGKKSLDAYEYGIYLKPYCDEVANGDAIYIEPNGTGLKCLHLDGLGHGREAEQVIKGVADVISLEGDLKQHLETTAHRLRGTRGAVGIACQVDVNDQMARLTGVGDMSGWFICNGTRKSIQFSPGILGHEYRTPESFEFVFPTQALLLTASDGIRRGWDIDTFPGLWRKHPQFIATFLGYMLGRNNDDKSIMCIRTTPPEKLELRRNHHG